MSTMLKNILIVKENINVHNGSVVHIYIPEWMEIYVHLLDDLKIDTDKPSVDGMRDVTFLLQRSITFWYH